MSQYITTTGLKNTLQSFLDKLKEWLPIKKTEESVIIQSPETFLNSIEIKYDGKIYILGTNNQPEHLQASLDKKGTTIVKSINDINLFLTEENIGRFIYVIDGNEEYPSGLYIIGIDANNGGVPILIRIGTTVGEKGLETRVVVLEQWKRTGMMDENDINDIIDPENNENNQ